MSSLFSLLINEWRILYIELRILWNDIYTQYIWIFLGTLSEKALEEQFGNSIEFVKSTSQILYGLDGKPNHPHDIPSPIEVAYQVANYGCERDTAWGNKVRETIFSYFSYHERESYKIFIWSRVSDLSKFSEK